MHNPFYQELIPLQLHNVSKYRNHLFDLVLTSLVSPVIQAAEGAIREEIESIAKLSALASNSPYYKYVSTASSETNADLR